MQTGNALLGVNQAMLSIDAHRSRNHAAPSYCLLVMPGVTEPSKGDYSQCTHTHTASMIHSIDSIRLRSELPALTHTLEKHERRIAHENGSATQARRKRIAHTCTSRFNGAHRRHSRTPQHPIKNPPCVHTLHQASTRRNEALIVAPRRRIASASSGNAHGNAVTMEHNGAHRWHSRTPQHPIENPPRVQTLHQASTRRNEALIMAPHRRIASASTRKCTRRMP